MPQVRLEHLSWRQAKIAFESQPVILIPVGAVEAHGPHLPLGADGMVAEAIALRAAQRSQALMVPTLWYGYSDGWRNFPGTISTRPETVQGLAEDLLYALSDFGLRHFIFVNNHGGNEFPLERTARKLQREIGILVAQFYPWQVLDRFLREHYQDYNKVRGHGAEPNTSVLLYLFPDDVDLSQATGAPGESWWGFPLVGPHTISVKGAHVEFYPDLDRVTPSGVTGGDPRAGSAELGRVVIEKAVEALVAFISAFREVTAS